MAKRVSVTREKLDEVRIELKADKGLTCQDISDEIGVNFKNKIYNGITFKPKVFKNLEALMGKEIAHKVVDHRNGVAYEKRVAELSENEDLAELFGMILGDGSIRDFSSKKENKYVTVYLLSFTFHQDEKEIIERAKNLVETCTGREPSFQNRKNTKAIDLRLYSKDLVELLEEKGLKSGNKTDNQVGVPGWIKQEDKYMRRCLRGLIDTDGTIYERVPGDTVIQFKNASKPLLADFDEMCGALGIRCSKGGYRTVQVAANDEIDKFIRLIQPIKARG